MWQKIPCKKPLLCFNSGDWEVPYNNYIWSQSHKMSRRQIRHSVNEGDTYIIAKST